MTDSPEPFADGRLLLHRGRVARLEITAPARRNAIGRDMWAAIPHICAAVAADEGVRAVVLCARPAADGPLFSAGADIAEFAEVYATPAAAAAYNATIRAALAALTDLPRPAIARIEGACIGGACALALACDLRMAAPSARFCLPPARLGLAYAPEDTARLVATIGPAAAKDLLFSARTVDAAEALAMGLVDRVMPAEALARDCAAYAETLAALSPASIRFAKAAVNAALLPPDPARAAALRAAYAACFAGPDLAEGRTAFLERRPPRF